jgi:hypothetical protein
VAHGERRKRVVSISIRSKTSIVKECTKSDRSAIGWLVA